MKDLLFEQPDEWWQEDRNGDVAEQLLPQIYRWGEHYEGLVGRILEILKFTRSRDWIAYFEILQVPPSLVNARETRKAVPSRDKCHLGDKRDPRNSHFLDKAFLIACDLIAQIS
ncbi:unnamed protein product [Orchesella dallaii]|uniref:Uncharacterized protein n=1 Tax=Orchesella dallaii TaxID=48710 RepID=A0ABP1RK68_9HEXA